MPAYQVMAVHGILPGKLQDEQEAREDEQKALIAPSDVSTGFDGLGAASCMPSTMKVGRKVVEAEQSRRHKVDPCMCLRQRKRQSVGVCGGIKRSAGTVG
jgi:hypothetical protein